MFHGVSPHTACDEVVQQKGSDTFSGESPIASGVIDMMASTDPGDLVEGTKTDCGVHNQSLDVRSTTLLVRQYVGSHCA